MTANLVPEQTATRTPRPMTPAEGQGIHELISRLTRMETRLMALMTHMGMQTDGRQRINPQGERNAH
jgi:hypothetical protein